MLRGKTCVIVGAAKGKGSRLVQKYAGQNYNIAFMDKDKESGNSLKRKMEQEYGKKVFFFHGDANNEEDLELFAGAVIAQWRKVDCLYYRSDIAEMVKEIERLLKGHVKRGGIIEDFFYVAC